MNNILLCFLFYPNLPDGIIECLTLVSLDCYIDPKVLKYWLNLDDFCLTIHTVSALCEALLKF